MTVDEMISDVRDHLQIFSQYILRDGTTPAPVDDDGNPVYSTSILRWLNQGMMDLLPTGIVKCTEHLALVVGQAEYGMTNDIHEIVHVTINGMPLDRVKVLGQDTRRPGWQDYSNNKNRGLPVAYYNYADMIGFDPAPDSTYTADILTDKPPAALSQPDDTPTRIPSRYHYLIAVRAALYCNKMVDAENRISGDRHAWLSQIWGKGYQEVKLIANDRGDDQDDQVEVMDYRGMTW